jgi:hypothetical protein
MRLLCSIVICLAVLGLSCDKSIDYGDAPETSVHEPEPEDDSSLSRREYAVLSVIVGTGNVVVESNTKKDFLGKVSPERAAGSYAGLSTETVEGYNRKSEIHVPVECNFQGNASCTVLTDMAVKELWNFKHENATEKWKGFRANYGSDRYYTVSRVGFNKDGNQGFAFVTSTCGTLCADATYYFLTL